MTTRFIPLVLNNTLMPDGERAFLLSLKSDGFGFPEVPLYAAPQPTRTSRMRMADILQVDPEEDPKPIFTMAIRSPYPANQGLITMSPVCTGSPVDPSVVGTEVNFYPADNQEPPSPVTYPVSGAIVPGNYFTTFNGKPIPHWVYSFSYEQDPGSYWIAVDFMHSIT